MSLDQAIIHGKERRRPYYDGRQHDKHCRNNGSCDWCRENRRIAQRRREESAKWDERDE